MRISMKIGTLSATAIAFSAMFAASPAYAQATRTWVSGTGDDANPCSRTAPCKTFAGAISKTAAGGAINCIDTGGFGQVTITKALAIICDNTEAGVLASGAGQSGVIVNAGVNDVVFLSGLDIEGTLTSSPAHGVRFLAGGALYVQNSIIRGFNDTNGNGITFTPSGASQLFVSNTTIEHNSSSGAGVGIFVQPGVAGSARVSLKDVRVQDNVNGGLRVDTTGSTSAAGVTVSVAGSVFAGNGGAGVAMVVPTGTTTGAIMIADSTVANNGTTGLIANGANATIRVGNSTITGNATGVNAAGGSTIASYGNNRLDGNPTVGTANNGAFSAAVAPH
jgi:hypothetical protein